MRGAFLFPFVYPKALRRVSTPAKELYFTFDDGPHPETTRALIQIFKTYNGRASFFFTGESVARYPELVMNVREAGHTIGHHGEQHLSGFSLSLKAFQNNVLAAHQRIPSSWFRPPYARLKLNQYKWLLSQNFVPVLFDVMPGDFFPCRDVEELTNRILEKIQPGSIIVLHENDKAAPKVLQVLQTILPALHNQGWVFRSLDQGFPERNAFK